MLFGLRVVLLIMAFVTVAQADTKDDTNRIMIQIGPYVQHWSGNAHHNEWSSLIGAEWENKKRWEIGGAVFKNSFYQPSIFLYGGRRWFLPKVSDRLYVKLMVGTIYGYKGQYASKVPFNYKGLSLAALPALGYQHDRTNVQMVVLGVAGVIFTFGYDFH